MTDRGAWRLEQWQAQVDTSPSSATWTPVMRAAVDQVRTVEHESIFNHSVRTFGHAAATGRRLGLSVDVEALFVACIFHDSGTATPYVGPERFEVEGADAAVRFLESWGWAADRMDDVWLAIALHTTPGIAERRSPIVRLTRAGVRADFGAGEIDDERQELEREYPRLDIELVLSRAVVRDALVEPAKAPRGSWPGALLEAHLADPEHSGLNPAF